MKPYHKIKTVFKRDPATRFRTLLWNQYACPEFALLRNCEWALTEKIDGMNIRVHWDGTKVRFGGRTVNAQIPTFLLDVLMDMFPPEKMLSVFGDRGGITLYGEGFGARIQKGGGGYIPDGVSFVLFDVAGGDVWFERSNVEEFALQLNIVCVQLINVGTLDDALMIAHAEFISAFGKRQAEGLVMRPRVELRTRLGHRVIAKIKRKDFV